MRTYIKRRTFSAGRQNQSSTPCLPRPRRFGKSKLWYPRWRIRSIAAYVPRVLVILLDMCLDVDLTEAGRSDILFPQAVPRAGLRERAG